MNGARKALVLAKALAYAIKTINYLPVEWREASDAADMADILEGMGEPWKSLAIQAANHHIDGGVAQWKMEQQS